MLIVFGGLPAVGKTTLSREVARRYGATWLRVDAIESAMWRAGIDPGQPTGLAGYAVANALAEAQLALGNTVVADAVNPVEEARAGWRLLTERQQIRLRIIEVTCPPQEHRRRVEARNPERDQTLNPTWQQIQDREYHPWTEPRLTVDSSRGVDVCLAEIAEYLAT